MDHTESGWKVSSVDIIFVSNFVAIDRPDQKEDLAFDFENKGPSIYYVIQIWGLGRPLPPYCNIVINWEDPPPCNIVINLDNPPPM